MQYNIDLTHTSLRLSHIFGSLFIDARATRVTADLFPAGSAACFVKAQASTQFVTAELKCGVDFGLAGGTPDSCPASCATFAALVILSDDYHSAIFILTHHRCNNFWPRLPVWALTAGFQSTSSVLPSTRVVTFRIASTLQLSRHVFKALEPFPGTLQVPGY